MLEEMLQPTQPTDEEIASRVTVVKAGASLLARLARALFDSSGSSVGSSSCPDAKPTDIVTPCERRRRALIAKARALRASKAGA